MGLYLCEHCFGDKELKAFCRASKNIGTCSFTKNSGVPVIDLSELISFFSGILQLFEDDSREGSIPLIEVLEKDWNLFSSKIIGTEILNEVLKITPSLLKPSLNAQYSNELRRICAPWSKLKDDLKWKKRFHINTNELIMEYGWDAIFAIQDELDTNASYYRARIHSEGRKVSYSTEEMKAPPREMCTAGRANVSGIPYLYLCDDIDTVFYEVRAAYLDDVSVGTFNQKDNDELISIVDFTKPRSLYSSDSSFDLKTIVQFKLLTELISKDLSKPMRRYDSEREYIPTQFICEFIRVVCGAKGIRFESSLYPGHTNLVIFEPELMECKEVAHHILNEINIKHS